MDYLLKKFEGALIGTFLGDSLGKEREGKRERVEDEYIEKIVRSDFTWDGDYTDDTEMMIALCEALVEDKSFNPEKVAEKFVENYHSFRGYGRGTRKIIRLLKKGYRWDEVAKESFPGGSYGNGAAMRITPLGLLFFNKEEELMENAILSSMITHYHPLGVEGGVLMAYSISMAVKKDLRTFIPIDFVDVLIEKEAYIREMVYKKTYVYNGEDKAIYLNNLKKIKNYLLTSDVSLKQIKREIGSSSKAQRSVVTAIYLFLRNFNQPFNAIIDAISMGGDTDTVGAMAGSLGGALGGIDIFPKDKIARLKDDNKGKLYILSLAKKLYNIYREKNTESKGE